jgi:asparagine synthase (glutamine-hydrolysing)
MPQWLASLTHTFRPIPAERLFIGRNRFYHFRPWFRDELAGTVREILLDERALQRSYLERHAVERAVQAHTAGNGNYGFELTKLLSIELIQRELLERSWN